VACGTLVEEDTAIRRHRVCRSHAA
jgi:hypothetical protein